MDLATWETRDSIVDKTFFFQVKLSEGVKELPAPRSTWSIQGILGILGIPPRPALLFHIF